ncbi:hypothetical protein AAG906_029356 [Vitis piasezkii]
MWGPTPFRFENMSILTRVIFMASIGSSSSFKIAETLDRKAYEDLEGLMRSLHGLHLSPSVPDARFWPLSSSGLFSVKSFFLALSQFSGSPQVFPSKFVWNSQVPFKVKSFVCMGNQQIIFFFIAP